jgi:hypothetical protein
MPKKRLRIETPLILKVNIAVFCYSVVFEVFEVIIHISIFPYLVYKTSILTTSSAIQYVSPLGSIPFNS